MSKENSLGSNFQPPEIVELRPPSPIYRMKKTPGGWLRTNLNTGKRYVVRQEEYERERRGLGFSRYTAGRRAPSGGSDAQFEQELDSFSLDNFDGSDPNE